MTWLQAPPRADSHGCLEPMLRKGRSRSSGRWSSAGRSARRKPLCQRQQTNGPPPSLTCSPSLLSKAWPESLTRPTPVAVAQNGWIRVILPTPSYGFLCNKVGESPVCLTFPPKVRWSKERSIFVFSSRVWFFIRERHATESTSEWTPPVPKLTG